MHATQVNAISQPRGSFYKTGFRNRGRGWDKQGRIEGSGLNSTHKWWVGCDRMSRIRSAGTQGLGIEQCPFTIFLIFRSRFSQNVRISSIYLEKIKLLLTFEQRTWFWTVCGTLFSIIKLNADVRYVVSAFKSRVDRTSCQYALQLRCNLAVQTGICLHIDAFRHGLVTLLLPTPLSW